MLQPSLRKLAAVLALASLGLPSFSCGGSEFSGGASSGGATSSSGAAGVSGPTTSSTSAGGRGGGGEGGAGGTANPDASAGDTGGQDAGGGGSGGRADAASDGNAGSSGSRDDGGGRPDVTVNDVASDISTSDAPTVLGRCTMGGSECPSGYQCGCGGPGPGICECHKKCQSAADCGDPNGMCGCSANDPVKICVNQCFCTCR